MMASFLRLVLCILRCTMTNHLETTQKYVLCYVQRESEVLLISKKRPDWQKGRYNLPGGHVEKDETFEAAARRELWEEAGILSENHTVYGLIRGQEAEVAVVRCPVIEKYSEIVYDLTDEQVWWEPIYMAMMGAKLMNNLRVIIPFMLAHYRGWVLYDDGRPFDFEIHAPAEAQ